MTEIQYCEREKGRFVKGHSGYWKGKKLSKSTKDKMGESRRGGKRLESQIENIRKSKIGNKNPSWKGDKVKYRALHEWIRKNKPKRKTCEDCGKGNRRLEVANISGKYKRDINDFEWLCCSCHTLKDNQRRKNG